MILYNTDIFPISFHNVFHCLSLVRFRNGAFKLNRMPVQKRIYIFRNGDAENNGSYLGCTFSGKEKRERGRQRDSSAERGA